MKTVILTGCIIIAYAINPEVLLPRWFSIGVIILLIAVIYGDITSFLERHNK